MYSFLAVSDFVQGCLPRPTCIKWWAAPGTVQTIHDDYCHTAKVHWGSEQNHEWAHSFIAGPEHLCFRVLKPPSSQWLGCQSPWGWLGDSAPQLIWLLVGTSYWQQATSRSCQLGLSIVQLKASCWLHQSSGNRGQSQLREREVTLKVASQCCAAAFASQAWRPSLAVEWV